MARADARQAARPKSEGASASGTRGAPFSRRLLGSPMRHRFGCRAPERPESSLSRALRPITDVRVLCFEHDLSK